MNNVSENCNIVPSGFRILYVLKILLDGKLSQKEINKELSQNPDIEQSFTKETLLKIINTLKISDIKIEKQNNKYFISKLPWQSEITPADLNTLSEFFIFIQSLGQKDVIQGYNDFLENLFRFLPDEAIGDFKKSNYKENYYENYFKHALAIKKIENYKNNESRIKILLKNSDEYFFDTYNIEYSSKDVFLTGYNFKNHENKTINFDEIKSLKQLPQKSSGIFFPSGVTFKIKGKLAKSYSLKENEKLIASNDNELIILNKGEDKQKLFKRILKYKNLCEIITSDNLRSEFSLMLVKILNNYKSL